jgi:rubrerythrin
MARDRVIVEFGTPADAKKVEETVKTGYAETSVETILQWIAVEEDLAQTYARLADSAMDQAHKGVYSQLGEQSKANVAELGQMLKSLESLDRARVGRIDLLSGLLS